MRQVPEGKSGSGQRIGRKNRTEAVRKLGRETIERDCMRLAGKQCGKRYEKGEEMRACRSQTQGSELVPPPGTIKERGLVDTGSPEALPTKLLVVRDIQSL